MNCDCHFCVTLRKMQQQIQQPTAGEAMQNKCTHCGQKASQHSPEPHLGMCMTPRGDTYYETEQPRPEAAGDEQIISDIVEAILAKPQQMMWREIAQRAYQVAAVYLLREPSAYECDEAVSAVGRPYQRHDCIKKAFDNRRTKQGKPDPAVEAVNKMYQRGNGQIAVFRSAEEIVAAVDAARKDTNADRS